MKNRHIFLNSQKAGMAQSPNYEAPKFKLLVEIPEILKICTNPCSKHDLLNFKVRKLLSLFIIANTILQEHNLLIISIDIS